MYIINSGLRFARAAESMQYTDSLAGCKVTLDFFNK